ncbi:MAG: hypothetical protein ABR915_04615 [Thermoguttaceae bacterium]|jgi:hypothetical protein
MAGAAGRRPVRGVFAVAYDPPDSQSDPFKPPAIPTAVHCIHCGQEYESYLMEWRIEEGSDGQQHGFWCCPVDGCDGRGFGFDIFPTDPEYRDENGGWVYDDVEEDEGGESGEEDFDPEEGENHAE